MENNEILYKMYEAVKLIQRQIKPINNKNYKIFVAYNENEEGDELFFELNKEKVKFFEKWFDDYNDEHISEYTKDQILKYDFNEYTFSQIRNLLKYKLERIREDNKESEQLQKIILSQVDNIIKELGFNRQLCLLKL